MSRPWPEIVDHYNARPEWDEASRVALAGLQNLARHIATGPLRNSLFGWTSVWDLCIQQGDHAPYSGPYLRVSPVGSGMIEFRYIDTPIRSRQWVRQVPAEAIIRRFDVFLEQLRWTNAPLA